MNNEIITIRKPFDPHFHGRDGETLKAILKYTAKPCAAATFMPNLEPPILTGEEAMAYKERIVGALEGIETSNFLPVMTIKITEQTTPEIIVRAHALGVHAGKIYPRGITTNAGDGVYNYRNILPVLKTMEEYNMLALFHGECPQEGIDDLFREKLFLTTLDMIVYKCPKLKIVLEHVSSSDGLNYILKNSSDNVACTITSHHLVLTMNDVIGSKCKPHNFCKPTAKLHRDRDALVKVVPRSKSKVFWGSDSAVHTRAQKECSEGCAGVFSAPVALSVLTQIFEDAGKLERLEDFTSTFAADFYGLELWDDTVTLVKQDWQVPKRIGRFVPWLAGQTLKWQIVS